MSIEAFQNAQGPKELRWNDGASHNDLYDKEQYVAPTIAKLTEFYAVNIADRALVLTTRWQRAETVRVMARSIQFLLSATEHTAGLHACRDRAATPEQPAEETKS
jgi:hypothetical protein